MKKLKLYAFTLITFLCFGVINVNAETVEVKDTETQTKLQIYKDAIVNEDVTEIVLGDNLDIRRLNGPDNQDAIRVNRNILLDLNGYTITAGEEILGIEGTIKVFYYGNYTLTIKDSSNSKNGKINSVCKGNVCSTAPIVLLNTEDCDHTIANCDSKLIIQDITISTFSTLNQPFQYLINIGVPESISKYNVEISNVKFENGLQAKQLFAHPFDYNATSPVLNLNIKSMNVSGNEIEFISTISGYKVKDILDSSKSELLVGETLITDPETAISNYDVSAGFKIREKSVIDIMFNDAQYGYSNINAKPITIKNNNSTSMQVKSVTVSDTDKFTVSGNTQPTIAVESKDNTSFTIKPVNGLSVGKHTATITVTDMDDKTYKAKVTFVVDKADITPSVSIDGWFYEDTANTPSVTGNTGKGTVTYEYKVQGTDDSTYSTVVPTNAGKYTLRATISPSTNYNGGVATADFKIDYKVTDGEDQEHIIGTNKDAVFRINADKSLFSKAYLGNEELFSEFYTITEGSTIITLKQEFLNNLLPGTHNLKATFTDGGEANTTFVIAQVVENNPKTGDSIMLSIILGSISLIGAGFFLKKRNA